MNWQALVDEAAQRIALAVAQNIAGRAYTHTEVTKRTTEAPRTPGAPRTSTSSVAEARRKLYDAHKAAGLCVQCSQPATHGVHCEKHNAKNKADSRRQYEKFKALKELHK